MLFLLSGTAFSFSGRDISHPVQDINTTDNYTPDYLPSLPRLSSGSNQDILNTIFNSKIQDFSELGYFPQVYDPSLQATYYGLHILDTLGKLNEISQTELVNYIMNHYNLDTNLFMDTLANRYLDTDFSLTYFPLSTVLEVNCYAVLSLDILGRLDLINTTEMINFMWDCQHPSSGGFIGQIYDITLDDGFKIATADNTYFAVITLDLLLDNWIGYSTEKNNIIQFVNDLQLPGGGFENDGDDTFDFLYPILEPSLLASYYCIKTLDIFGMVSSINIPNFHLYLDSLNNGNYFDISVNPLIENHTNIVATSIGLELSNITNYSGIDMESVISFILTNRNSLGNWDQSTTIAHHELIDTFQIVRSLNNTEEISRLSLEDKNQIGNATFYYQSYQGFSHLSENYTSMNLLYTIIASFNLFDRLSDLDIQQLYLQVKNSYEPFIDFRYSRFFYGYVLHNTPITGLRSYPIEYYTQGSKNYIDEISLIASHENTYLALDILQRIFKLDDFASEFNLMDLANDISDTQFLNGSYLNTFGAFSYMHKYTGDNSENINKKIYCDYSYYAIRCLEIIADFFSLSLGDLGFDITALYTYLDRNIIETPSILYFDPNYSSNIEIILKCTYYMIYILEALDMNDKDTDKIESFVLSSLDYNNIENIYYCYKIFEILNLDIPFNASLIQDLVPTILDSTLNEFYITKDRIDVNQETFLWICEIARNSEIKISATYEVEASLGSYNEITAFLQNLIIQDFGSYVTFKFESTPLGTVIFDKMPDNSYFKRIFLPLIPQCYPQVDGKLCAYEGSNLKAELPISFLTTYNLTYDLSTQQGVRSWTFHINSSFIADSNYHELTYGNAYIQVYVDNIYRGSEAFSHTPSNEFSLFDLEHTPGIEGDYLIQIYLNDGFQVFNIENITFTQSPIIAEDHAEIVAAIPLTITFLAVPGATIMITSRQLGKSKEKSKLK